MAAPAILKIDIVADATKALKAMSDTSDAAGGIGGSMKSIGKVIGPALGTAAVVGFGKASVSAAQESEVANARLESVYRSMGDANGDATKAAQNYATALSKKTGIDDEAILAGQAQLATFGEVSGETARLAGIFDRATAAGADLAAAGFGTIDSNAVQLGKALQDPTKGMTALAKSGVTFTDSQKDQIRAMQESGDLLGAQKIVLAAVEQQVGGTAEATSTSTQKMATAFGEVQEQIGGALLPVVSTLADVLSRYMGILLPLGGAILAVVVAMKAWEAAQAIWNGIQAVGNALFAIWNALIYANPIMLIVLAIVAVIAILVLLYFKVGWFRDLVDAAFHFVVDAFNWIVDAAKAVYQWIASNWPLLLAILGGPFGIAILLITKNFDTIKDVAAAMVGWVSDRFSDLVGFVSRVGQTMSGIMSAIGDAIRLPIDAATAMYNWVRDKFQALLDFVQGVKDRIGGIASGIANGLRDPINAVIRAWNAIEFTLPAVDWGPVHVGGNTFGTPNIPTLATGGRVLRTGLALVHEGETFSGVGRSLGGGTVINVTVSHTGLGADSPQLQRDIVTALRHYVGRNGPLGAPIVSPAA